MSVLSGSAHAGAPPAPRPANERERLEALRRYGILDTPPELPFDDIARLASHICGTPVAAISLIDADRQWFKAKVGFDACETTRDAGFCAHTILQDGPLVVNDATADTRFAELEIVRGGPRIRFYAGAPLVTPSGHRIGALAVNDVVVRQPTAEQLEALLALSRQVVAQLELRRALELTTSEALTDALTGLGNRRRLLLDLEARLRTEEPLTLMFLDLDGFKRYNDLFGHAAGDALLARLAEALADTIRERGAAYRMGGDEFCVLLDDPRLGAAAVAALCERGEGFDITCSCGSVSLPAEAGDVSHALRLADERMYVEKNSRPGSVRAQTTEVISRILAERTPELHRHVQDVTELARMLGAVVGLRTEELDELGHAAELHDIGKIAIPEEILDKPSLLTAEEWRFLRRHTLIGERILGAAPALEGVARIVRSSHEHWDGSGYPDGLRAQEIPLASRIILLCDAYHAMTTDRPYQQHLSTEAAVAELQRCSGAQFDPELVELFWVQVAPTAGSLLPAVDAA